MSDLRVVAFHVEFFQISVLVQPHSYHSDIAVALISHHTNVSIFYNDKFDNLLPVTFSALLSDAMGMEDYSRCSGQDHLE